MSQITEGPLPVEDAATNYAVGLYNRLRYESGWRKDTFSLLRQEYAHFVRLAIVGDFDVQAMWEYGWLVGATHQYLRHKESKTFSAWFYKKVCADLAGINAQIKRLEFDETEKDSMRRAFERMAPLIKGWETPKEARG